MKSPLDLGPLLELESVDSTQNVAASYIRGELQGVLPGVVLAWEQLSGRGRFGRPWFSSRGDSLTMSVIVHDCVNHPKPWLLGMGMACAVAGAIHAHVRWPNDLTLHGKKLGGILTELIQDPNGRRIPVIGVGINLNQKEFPWDMAPHATSLLIEHGHEFQPIDVLKNVLKRWEELPDISSWRDLEPVWALFDQTPGKQYKLQNGGEATAISIGTDGELICSVGGEVQSILAADALFS
jgi:BirA family biotin operon repressor/biotin-[acetyl-CoA-carboxylase] ligase